MDHNNKNNKKIDLRRHPRISWPFVARFRPKGNEETKWEIPIIQNISEGGCFFYCSSFQDVGQILEIEIRFPLLEEPMRFIGEVKRADFKKDGQAARYGIAVCFLEMEEEKKKDFIKTVNFFLKKQQKRKK